MAMENEVDVLKAELLRKQGEIDALNWVKAPACSPEIMFKTLFEGASTAIFMADVQSAIILDCNSAAADLMGYSRHELIGMHQTNMHPPEHSVAYHEQFRRYALAPGTKNYQAQVQHKNGQVIPVIISARPADLDGRKIMIGFFTDITEQKRTEEALRESEDKFKAIFDRAAMGIAISDRNGYIRDCNTAYQEMLGYTLEELRQMRYVEFTHPDDNEHNLRLQGWLEDGLIDKYQLEKRYIRKNGETFWCRLVSSAIRKDGEYMYGVSVFEDIDERKQADEELKNAKARAELYLDLMGHDINNLNQIALGYLELIGGQLQDPDLRELFARPVEAISNSSKLIDNVRKLQKITSGNKKIPVFPMDILEPACRQFATIPGVSLSLDSPGPDDITVLADELLVDVFTNILGNAVKHRGPQDDLQLNIRPVLVCENGSRYCHVMIEDNGPGIPDGRKCHIFDRFSRASTKAKGSGLGLYLVRSLVDSYGGKVWVEDRVRGDHTQGARFVIRLPTIA